MSQDIPQNLRPQDFHLTHPCFELCRSRSPYYLYPTCVPTHLEPMSQDTPQNLRPQDFHLTHPCFELCRNRSPYYTPHVCQPILNQCPKTHHKTSDPKIFISHIPVLNFAGADLHIYTPHVCQPILNQCPKTDHKTSDPNHTTSDPKIFISHIPVLNLARNRCRV